MVSVEQTIRVTANEKCPFLDRKTWITASSLL